MYKVSWTTRDNLEAINDDHFHTMRDLVELQMVCKIIKKKDFKTIEKIKALVVEEIRSNYEMTGDDWEIEDYEWSCEVNKGGEETYELCYRPDGSLLAFVIVQECEVFA